jgi:hypothetical protein
MTLKLYRPKGIGFYIAELNGKTYHAYEDHRGTGAIDYIAVQIGGHNRRFRAVYNTARWNNRETKPVKAILDAIREVRAGSRKLDVKEDVS